MYDSVDPDKLRKALRFWVAPEPVQPFRNCVTIQPVETGGWIISTTGPDGYGGLTYVATTFAGMVRAIRGVTSPP